MSKPVKVTISTISLLKVVAVALAFWFLYDIRAVIAILFVAIILTSALEPTVSWFAKKKIPRIFGVLVIYIILASFVSSLVILILPPAIHQIQNLAADFPAHWSKISSSFSFLQDYSDRYNVSDGVQTTLDQLENFLTQRSSGLFDTLTGIFGGIFSFIIILVLTFYLLLEESAAKRTLRLVTPAKYQPYLTRLLFRMQNKIGLWLRGQIILSFIVGIIVFIGLSIFGIFYPVFGKYALVLAMLAFLLEFIPYLGPILAAIPAIFIGLAQSLPLAGFILAFYCLMQWSENNILVPQVMKRAVGLNPIIVITALMIGAKIGGIIGMVLAIPVATAIAVLMEDISGQFDEQDE
ncbi:MAG: AI-2E family transporter [Patescibacteria group bacterium]|jgi:predicted PurR-regulated permease PerM